MYYSNQSCEFAAPKKRNEADEHRLSRGTFMQNLDEAQVAQLPITSDPEILSGETVFRGTRVPVAALLDNIEAGLTLDEFIDNFPTVTREQAVQVLEFAKETLTRLGRAA